MVTLSSNSLKSIVDEASFDNGFKSAVREALRDPVDDVIVKSSKIEMVAKVNHIPDFEEHSAVVENWK